MKTFTTVDKTEWDTGPWQDEPDKAVWIDEATGLDCMVKRGGGGALCGYVGVPPTHPWHGWDYDDMGVDVHGGLTYGATCWGDESTGICHIPEPGRPHDVWWFGFDCSHAWDLRPEGQKWNREHGLTIDDEVYRDFDYVKREVESLAEQIAAVSA